MYHNSEMGASLLTGRSLMFKLEAPLYSYCVVWLYLESYLVLLQNSMQILSGMPHSGGKMRTHSSS